MQNMTFHATESSRHPQIQVEDFSSAFQLIILLLESTLGQVSNNLGIRVQSDTDDNSHIVHFQIVGDEFFIQIYSPNNEGWQTLAPKGFKLNKPAFKVFEDFNGSEYFELLSSEGVCFSRAFLVSIENILLVLNYLSDSTPNHWFDELNWINLGVI